MTVRLVVADDHPIVRDGLIRLFEAESGWQVVAACGDGEATLQAILDYRPDLLILDLRMPQLHGLAVLRRMAEQGLEVTTVVLTADLSDDDLAEAVRLGARGIVLKESASNVLVECVRTVIAGGRWFEGQSTGRVLERLATRDAAAQQIIQSLTAREIEIARLASYGLRSKEIAARLRITDGTVKIHLHNVYQKLGVVSRVELANRVRGAGMS